MRAYKMKYKHWLQMNTAPKDSVILLNFFGKDVCVAEWLDSPPNWVDTEYKEEYYNGALPDGWLPLFVLNDLVWLDMNLAPVEESILLKYNNDICLGFWNTDLNSWIDPLCYDDLHGGINPDGWLPLDALPPFSQISK